MREPLSDELFEVVLKQAVYDAGKADLEELPSDEEMNQAYPLPEKAHKEFDRLQKAQTRGISVRAMLVRRVAIIAITALAVVFGGLRTDIHNQVCDEDDHPIPGLYNVGIMAPQQYTSLVKDSDRMVRLVIDKQANSVGIGSLLSTTAAYEWIFLDEQLAARRQQLQKCNLDNYIEPNLFYDRQRSETELDEQLSSIPTASGMVMEGQRIIDRGDIVDSHTYRVLNSFEQAIERRNASEDEVVSTIMGQSLYVLVLMVLFTTYLTLYHKEYFLKPRSLTMLFTMLVIFPVVVSLMMQFNKFSVYLVPFAIAPIFIRVFMDSRTAFNAHVTMVLICADISHRSARHSGQHGGLSGTATHPERRHVEARRLNVHTLRNQRFLPAFRLPDDACHRKDVRLRVYGDSVRALQHQQRAAAPHERGGSRNIPAQHHGGQSGRRDSQPHRCQGTARASKLTEIESARIIVGHVTEGLKMAEKKNLPAVITDFIRTHHGRGLAKFFYIKYKNAHPNEEVDTAPFSYPGPNPQTREQAILMMADSVEAASRSLSDYSEESISQLVNRIIDSQLAEGFFTDCPITFYDISQAKQVLIERLMSIYHTRIKYPRLKQQNKDETAASEEQ